MTMRLLPAVGLLVTMAVPAEAQQIDPAWMHTDSASKSVTFDLTAGLTNVNGSLNFNGFTGGALTFVVPAGWRVGLRFSNLDHALTHSVEIITPRSPLPIQAIAPTLTGAGSKELLLGLAAGQPAESIRFLAAPAGDYIVYCGVPGHGMAGMWLRLTVDATARTPRMIVTPTPATH